MNEGIARILIRNSKNRRVISVNRVAINRVTNKYKECNKWYVFKIMETGEIIFEPYNESSEAFKRAAMIEGKVLKDGKEVEFKVIGDRIMYPDNVNKRMQVVKMR